MIHHKHYLIAEEMPDEFAFLNVGIAEVMAIGAVSLVVFVVRKIRDRLRHSNTSLRDIYGGLRGETTRKH